MKRTIRILYIFIVTLYVTTANSMSMSSDEIELPQQNPVPNLREINSLENVSIHSIGGLRSGQINHQTRDNISEISDSVVLQASLNHKESIDSIFLGKKNIGFSSKFLENYTKRSALFWNICNAILDDTEGFIHAAATCLIIFTCADTNLSSTSFITLSLQIAIIANAINKLNNFAGKVIVARNSLALACIQRNNLQHMQDNLHHEPQNLRELSKEEEEFINDPANYSTPFLQGFYKRLTEARIVMWDIFGVSSIIFQSAGYSLANWSAYSSDNRRFLLTCAAISGLLGNFCELSLKKIKQNTESAEQTTLKSMKYNTIIKETVNTYAKRNIEESKDQSAEENV